MKKLITASILACLVLSCQQTVSNPAENDFIVTVTIEDKTYSGMAFIKPGLQTNATFDVKVLYSEIDNITITKGSEKIINETVSGDSFSKQMLLDAPKIGGYDTYTINAEIAGKNVESSLMVYGYPAEPPPDLIDDDYVEEVLPSLFSFDAGIQFETPPTGTVYYFNPAGTKAESDIQIDFPDFYQLNAKKYIQVSGKAMPDDSGFTDRTYHSVDFSICLLDSADEIIERWKYTFLVDSKDQFNGYLYFPKIGNYSVYAYREYDYNLYPKSRGTLNIVDQGWSTLVFKVNNLEGIPASALAALPSADTDSANPIIQKYAEYITQYCKTDLERAEAIYHFIVFGDSNGVFTYTYDKDQWPQIANIYSSFHIASSFLIDRIGVCNDFAELYAAMVRSIGIEVKMQRGEETETEPGHMWNIVYIANQEYHVDCTWGNGNIRGYKKYAEFYPDFNLQDFKDTHDLVYALNVRLTY